MGWSHGKGVSLWLGELWASSAPCLIPFISAMEMPMPLWIARLGIILKLQSLQLDYYTFF